MDLWPEDLTDGIEDTKAPLTILKVQGNLLGKKTRNYVMGKVRSSVDNQYEEYDENFRYTFVMDSSTLGYSYDLFRVIYGISFYPLEIEFEEERMTVDSEDEFYKSLKKIFSSSKTKKVVRAILQQLEYRPIKASEQEEDDIPF